MGPRIMGLPKKIWQSCQVGGEKTDMPKKIMQSGSIEGEFHPKGTLRSLRKNLWLRKGGEDAPAKKNPPYHRTNRSRQYLRDFDFRPKREKRYSEAGEDFHIILRQKSISREVQLSACSYVVHSKRIHRTLINSCIPVADGSLLLLGFGKPGDSCIRRIMLERLRCAYVTEEYYYYGV